MLTEHRIRIGARDILLLEGPAGWGECSPLPGYPCDPAAARRAGEESATQGFPPRLRDRVPVNALVDSSDFEPDALSGYCAVKVKMRTPADLDVVERVRATVGPSVGVRVDVNAAWDVDTAIDVGARLARLGVELYEQPVASLEELALVRRACTVPIAADESIRGVDDVELAARLGAVDVVVLKVQALGGVRAALDVAAAAERVGIPVLPTSMMETSVGLLAGLALGCALPDLPFLAGLATASASRPDVSADPLIAIGGFLEWREIVPDPDLLARYGVAGPSSQVLST